MSPGSIPELAAKVSRMSSSLIRYSSADTRIADCVSGDERVAGVQPVIFKKLERWLSSWATNVRALTARSFASSLEYEDVFFIIQRLLKPLCALARRKWTLFKT